MPKDLPKPWRRVRRGKSYDYTVLQIREDTVRHPGTGELHPRVILEMPDWATVVALTESSEVVMVRQFRFGIWQNSLELPGGLVDPGEDAKRGAARELEEETGYQAKKLVRLGKFFPNPALQTNACHQFLAEGCRKVHAGSQDHGEDVRVELVRYKDIPRLIRRGQISHGVMLNGFFLYELYKKA